jgi:murein DD-endopeptidase MepM/ murein hydrolase activator NlpD
VKKDFMRIGFIILSSMPLLALTFHCNHTVHGFPTVLLVDPAAIADSLLPITIEPDDRKFRQFESEIAQDGLDKVKIDSYLDILFRYRDPTLLPLYFALLQRQDLHSYFKAMAIYVIGETGGHGDFDRLYQFWRSEQNDLVREYIAAALGKIANSSHIPLLNKMAAIEKNGYARTTLEAGIRRAKGNRRTRIAYLPSYDTIRFRKLKTYPAEKTSPETYLLARKKIDTAVSRFVPAATDCIPPHQQYKQCRSIYDKVKQPFYSFGLPGVFHVGEDSGWLFAGMGVHAVMEGRVALIQHEESWGCLVCVESALPDKTVVCAYYGHLSSNLDVTVGQIVKMGDRLGEIGPPFSLENGGYRSHLHLGIEKAPIGTAVIAGYDEHIGHWYDPVTFIKEKKSFGIKMTNN